jgi:hypothetical protein
MEEDIYSILSKKLFVMWLAIKRLYLTGITPKNNRHTQKGPIVKRDKGQPTEIK